MKEKIIEILARVTGQDPAVLKDDTIIREIKGFDSLQFVMMISELEESHDIEIPLDMALEVETVGDLVTSAKQK